MQGELWSSERVEQFKALWDQGHSFTQIAKALGVTKNAVAGRANRMGLRKSANGIIPRRWTAEEDRKLMQMHEAGLSNQEAADHLGVTRHAAGGRISRILRRRGRTLKRSLRSVGNLAQKPRPALLPRVKYDKRVPELFRSADKRCQWIVGDPTADDSCKCGAEATDGPYCAEHMAMAYIAPRPQDSAERPGGRCNRDPRWKSKDWADLRSDYR